MYKINKSLVIALGTALLLSTGIARAQTTPAAATAMPAAPAAKTMPASPAAASTTAAAPAAMPTAKVAQAQFTTAVNNREPADDITTLDNSHTQVFFFTALSGAAGQTITHRWEFNGQTMAEVKFEPKANHWRVWSSKTLAPGDTGTWTVEVVDGSGNVLTSKTFDYTKAAAMSIQATHKPPVMQNAPSPASTASTKSAPPPIL
ncbi:MAG: DUF2914 domain-containing protein [Gammaproteobacteria bacterium]